MRRIAVVTGSRSEWGILAPVVAALQSRNDVEAGVIVTGTHLTHGTAEDVTDSGYPVWGTPPMYASAVVGYADMPAAVAQGVRAIGAAYVACAPNIVVVLGDRPEAMAAAVAAYYLRIPVAHIHGGERTDAHIDDSTRHAITRLAALHFAASAESATRLRAMGEEPWRIHAVGSPGLDTLRGVRRERVGGVVFLYHPHTPTYEQAGAEARAILAALDGRHVIAVYPNGDPGSAEVIAAIADAGVHAVSNLRRAVFVRLLASCEAIVGNSSCGIIEACYLGIPALNVGARNRGREHGGNVLFCSVRSVARGVTRVLSPTFRAQAQRTACPWGDGRASVRIARVLSTVPLGDRLLAKRLADDASWHADRNGARRHVADHHGARADRSPRAD